MDTTKTTIASGVGKYPMGQGDIGVYYLKDALIFLESHCTHPELYQDIKNKLSDIRINEHPATNYSPAYAGYKIPEKELAFYFGLTSTHNVLRVGVSRRRHRIFSSLDSFYLSVTNDGLICDITEKPNSNPVNEKIVLIRPSDEKQ